MKYLEQFRTKNNKPEHKMTRKTKKIIAQIITPATVAGSIDSLNDTNDQNNALHNRT